MKFRPMPWCWWYAASTGALLILEIEMTVTDLKNAVRFLEKVFVGQADEEILVVTIHNLKQEIRKREKNERRTR